MVLYHGSLPGSRPTGIGVRRRPVYDGFTALRMYDVPPSSTLASVTRICIIRLRFPPLSCLPIFVPPQEHEDKDIDDDHD